MAQYINKSALVAEIERRRDAALMRQRNLEAIGQVTVLDEMVANQLNRILSFINTLEVKEVQDEPVSEDLEEAADVYSKVFSDIVAPYIRKDAFIAGANWKKTKDMAVIKMTKELLEDFDKHCDKYHEAGFKHGQEALMKEAVEATVYNKAYPTEFEIETNTFMQMLKHGDKVKVIVIKED